MNFLGTMNQLVAGPAAQMARPPLVPLPLGKGGEGFAPSGFFPEWNSEAVKEKTAKEVPYYPLTEGQRDYMKGGFTQAPQQETPQPAPAARARKTEFF